MSSSLLCPQTIATLMLHTKYIEWRGFLINMHAIQLCETVVVLLMFKGLLLTLCNIINLLIFIFSDFVMAISLAIRMEL
jgi:hypothetical protein